MKPETKDLLAAEFGRRGGNARWRGKSAAEKREHALAMLAARYAKPRGKRVRATQKKIERGA